MKLWICIWTATMPTNCNERKVSRSIINLFPCYLRVPTKSWLELNVCLIMGNGNILQWRRPLEKNCYGLVLQRNPFEYHYRQQKQLGEWIPVKAFNKTRSGESFISSWSKLSWVHVDKPSSTERDFEAHILSLPLWTEYPVAVCHRLTVCHQHHLCSPKDVLIFRNFSSNFYKEINAVES